MKRSAPPRKTAGVHPPDWTLRFLYIGTADFERDLAYYRETLGARLVWHFEHFGAGLRLFHSARARCSSWPTTDRPPAACRCSRWRT
jgi:hypothetical protein